MDIRFFNTEIDGWNNSTIELTAITNKFLSLSYTTHYREAAEFELVMYQQDFEQAYLKGGRIDYEKFSSTFVLFGAKKLGLIQKIVKSFDGGVLKLIFKGTTCLGLLNYRSLDNTIKCSGNILNFLGDKIGTKFFTEGDRAMPEISLSFVEGENIKKWFEVTGGTVMELVQSTLESSGCFIEATFDGLNLDGDKKLHLKINFKPYNFKRKQENYPTIVLDENDIENSEWSFDTSDYFNVAYVHGEGEGPARKMEYVEQPYFTDRIETKGLLRRELYVDARDLQSEGQDGEPNLSPNDYKALLVDRGKEKLREKKPLLGYSITLRKNTKALEGFFVGDVLSIKDKCLDLIFELLVAKTEEVWTKDGYAIVYSLQNWR